MVVAIPYRRAMHFSYGKLEPVAPGLRRIVARNPSPFSFHGTGTYVVGAGEVAVIDPGPLLPDHVAALLDGLGDEKIRHILVTHTHVDHSPATALLQAATGAPSHGFGPHGFGPHGGRPAAAGEVEVEVEEGGDRDFVPDIRLGDGDVVAGPGYTIEALHTPGHTSNHLCFAWREPGILFTGDHVMGWSTSVVSPPDGDMADYLASLRRLLGRDDRVYWPTHGPAITAPRPHVEAFLAHRAERERQILNALARGPATIAELVPQIYLGLAPGLHAAAARSMLAHLLQAHDEGRVAAAGDPGLGARWWLA